MSLMMLIFWALVGAGVVWLVRGRRGAPSPGVGEARRILDERFARGEISEDDFRQRRDLLSVQ